MKKILRKVFSLLLVAILTSTMLVGCKKEKVDPVEKEDLPATSVNYNEEGIYETRISAKDYKSLKKENVVVTYSVLDRTVKGLKGQENADKEPQRVLKKAMVKEIVQDETGINLVFEAQSLKKDNVQAFEVSINDETDHASVFVNYPVVNMEVSPKEVTQNATDIRVAFSLKDDEFEDAIKDTDIYLGGSFKDMHAKVVSQSPNNLTVNLTGKVNADLNTNSNDEGVILLNPAIIKNNVELIQKTISVVKDRLYFDPTSLTYKDGITYVTLEAVGLINPMEVKDVDVTFEHDVVVNKVINHEKSVDLELQVAGSTDVNSAAKVLNGQVVSVKGTNVEAIFNDASFYPVFDYVEEDGDNFNITLKLLANDGVFAQKLDAKKVSLENDFKGGSVKSFERVDDKNATLIIAVPRDGQTEDTLSKDGKIILAKGSFINDFNALSDEVSYSRVFSQDTLGKGEKWDKTVQGFKTFVGFFDNPTFKTITDVVGGVSGACEFVKGILEVTGVIKSDAQKAEELAIKNHQEVMSILNKHTELLNTINKKLDTQLLNQQAAKLDKLQQANNVIFDYYADATHGLKDKDGNKVEVPSINASKKTWEAYAEIIGPKVGSYRQYDDKFSVLHETYIEVCSDLMNKDQSRNPIMFYINTLKQTKNFETELFDPVTQMICDYRREISKAYMLIELNSIVIGEEHSLRTEKQDFKDSIAKIDDIDKNIISKLNWHEWNKDTLVKVYCFTFDDYVYSQLGANYHADSTFIVDFEGAGFSWIKERILSPMIGLTDEQIYEFANRLHGEALSKCLDNAGLIWRTYKTDKKGNFILDSNGHRTYTWTPDLVLFNTYLTDGPGSTMNHKAWVIFSGQWWVQKDIWIYREQSDSLFWYSYSFRIKWMDLFS